MDQPSKVANPSRGQLNRENDYLAGDWKAIALEADVWVETVTEGGLRFMAAWRKQEVDVARHRQEKKEATRLGKLYRTRKGRTCEATPIGLLAEPKESYTGPRRTETCVAPRHVEASRDTLLAMCSFCSLCCTRPVLYFYIISSVLLIS